MSAAHRPTKRTETIVEVLRDAFAPMMRSDPVAFRGEVPKDGGRSARLLPGYGAVRADHAPFVEAFRSGTIGVKST